MITTDTDENPNKTFVLNPNEKRCIESLRDLFQGKIPKDLDTDLNLRRWANGWRCRLDEIEPRLKAYIENRKALKIDRPDYLHDFDRDPNFEKSFQYFSFSTIDKPWINTKDNTLLVVERLENIDFHAITDRMLTCGEILTVSFRCMEAAFRHVLARENSSGRPSGVTILYDAYGINILEYANPNSPIVKYSNLCFGLFQDYYCNVMSQIYVVNAPRLIGLCWELIKRFMSPATQRKVVFLGSNYKEILKEKIDLEILPVHYGGLRTDRSGKTHPETCCNVPVLIPENYRRISTEFNDDEFATEYIKPHGVLHIREQITEANAKLIWKFWTNSDVEFSILKENSNDNGTLVYPRLTYITPKLAENGELICTEPGNYILEFKNTSTTLFSLKLDYCVKVVYETDEIYDG